MQEAQVDSLLRVSEKLRVAADKVGKFGSVFIVPLVVVTMWDVVIRKVGGLQVWLIENVGPIFESTIIQELEWHFHTALFVLVLGYGYVNNRHVRVDLVREKLQFRRQAWIEFVGITFFLVPYTLIVGWFALNYAVESFLINEISASTVGLPMRWIIKSFLFVGLLVTFLAGVSVWLQVVCVLFGPQEKRFSLMTLEWPEEQSRKEVLRKRIAENEKAKKLGRQNLADFDD